MGDIADDIFDSMLEEEDDEEMARKSVESRWRRGNHKTKNGKLIKISEMKTWHLCNTVKFFSRFNTKPLTDEIQKRLKN